MANPPFSKVNGHSDAGLSPTNTVTTVFNASSVAEIKATLSHLHEQEASVTARLDALVASQRDFSRELGRLDLLRANLGSQTSTTRAISHGMLADAATTADRISSAVRRLDHEQSRVKATLAVVDQVAELKACVLGVAGSMGAPQDWETAASYLHRAAKIPPEVIHGAFAAEMVPTAEVPDPPHVTLDNAAESLCGLFLREFDKAVQENNGARITRFFKLFPLIGRSEVGLDVYGRYVCQGVAARARSNLNASGGQAKDGFFYASALTKLFEHIAQIIDGHGSLVERHYGPRKMNRVIERLQLEADVQGGIILDTWSDERHVDRKLTDIKSYAFTFLVQSFLPPQRGGGTPRSNSPATRDGVAEDEGVDMKEIDGLLNEMAVMLGRWSLYCRFLADTCNPPGENESTNQFALPEFLRESSLARKISERLAAPFNTMTTFFFRRSVEKAFQLDEQPSGLTLNPHKPLKADPPHITSAVDDIMYIVNKVLQQSLATSQISVVTNVVPTVSRVLGSDFIGMTQRKMRDECYPRAAVQGAQPPESLTISFLVLINNLDVAVDYIRRILHKHTEQKIASQTEPSSTSTDPIQALFPSPTEAQLASQTLHSLTSTFESKVTDLLNDGIQVIFNNVIKHRLRPILSDSFRDIEYQPRDDTDPVRTVYHTPVIPSMNEYYDSDDPIIGGPDAGTADGEADPGAELVRPRFATAWNELLLPISRILTASAFDRLLTVTVAYLARLLEKRLWSYHGRVNALGATRLERDVSGVVGAAVDVGGSQGRYRHRDAFVRCLQMVLVMGMDEDEWEDVMRGGETAEVVEKLSREERMRVRAMVRRA
ncbi:COG4-domain-containing protein [Aspergillus japonicus CBS 114.51]|uniref:Conserved oligomeric Golgi complex subunit 4 n=2 Tax=Aspergillus TaxID=5052 RepID=A0A2V5HBQ9_ASPV1|nr:COG4-domain-containing protein [Aspergillus japonicus CBS 114.51]PYI19792.1 COG4-domain-containing protein [Aspergillus violaceofuscus CBS 115571]RAH77455.1 COG4-domain-containing protein [Aspergillus japonicus CBS 114.51]